MVFGHRTAFGVRAYRIWCTAVSQMEYGRIANGVRCENRVMLPFVYGVWVNGHYVIKGSKYIRTRCESCELMGIIGGYALCRPLRGSLGLVGIPFSWRLGVLTISLAHQYQPGGLYYE